MHTHTHTHANAVAAHMNLLEVQERLSKLNCLFLTHNKTVSKQRESTRKHQKAYALSTGTDSNQQHTNT